MKRTGDIGNRIELVPMDPHFHDISVGLYREELDGVSTYRVHTFSSIEGSSERIEFIVAAMVVLGGMERTEEAAPLLRFHCGHQHEKAAKRNFLDSCKLDSQQGENVRPLHIFDKKTGRTITVEKSVDSTYALSSDGEDKGRDKRISAVVNGLLKLGEMEQREGTTNQVSFPCGQAHDALIGLLLTRALNVRAVIREQEMAASRGVLSSPSSQE